jgi:hypothetical protein
MKLRLHTPIPHAIHLEFKHQPRTRYPHIEREIQIIKLHTLGRRQSRKQALGHAIQIRSKRAHIDKALAERIGRALGVACNEVVFDDEGLAGAEVAGVVEGYGC